jgi:hypothetical protein
MEVPRNVRCRPRKKLDLKKKAKVDHDQNRLFRESEVTFSTDRRAEVRQNALGKLTSRTGSLQKKVPWTQRED